MQHRHWDTTYISFQRWCIPREKVHRWIVLRADSLFIWVLGGSYREETCYDSEDVVKRGTYIGRRERERETRWDEESCKNRTSRETLYLGTASPTLLSAISTEFQTSTCLSGIWSYNAAIIWRASGHFVGFIKELYTDPDVYFNTWIKIIQFSEEILYLDCGNYILSMSWKIWWSL